MRVQSNHRDIHSKLKNLTDLIQVYSDTNKKVLVNKKDHPALLLEVSKLMEEMQ